MSTSSEDIDALFDVAAPAPTSGPSASPLASAPAAPHLGDNRREHRIKVSWPARLQLPGGRVIELRVRDLSESGVGLLTDVHIPPATVLNFAMGVPGLDDPKTMTPVSGTLRTTYIVFQGRDMCCGGTWVSLPEAHRELLAQWMRKRRR